MGCWVIVMMTVAVTAVASWLVPRVKGWLFRGGQQDRRKVHGRGGGGGGEGLRKRI